MYDLRTPEEVGLDLAKRLKEARLARNWRQATLARRSGVSLGSLRRFEASGRVSLRSLLRLAFTLDCLGDFDAVFRRPEAATMAELEARQEEPRRQRGQE